MIGTKGRFQWILEDETWPIFAVCFCFASPCHPFTWCKACVADNSIHELCWFAVLNSVVFWKKEFDFGRDFEV